MMMAAAAPNRMTWVAALLAIASAQDCPPGQFIDTNNATCAVQTLTKQNCISPCGFNAYCDGVERIPCRNERITLIQNAIVVEDCVCPIGFYGGVGDDCELCNPGQLCNETDLQEPFTCPGGFFCPADETFPLLVPCSTAEFCPPGSTERRLCPQGSFCPTSTMRFPCDPGDYCPSGSTSRSLCPAGFYCETPSRRLECNLGDFCPEGNLRPIACPAGSYCPSPTLMFGCDDPGQFCPSNSSTPGQCPPGFMCPTSVVQIRCPPGTFSNVPGSTECTVCPSNFFCEDGLSVEECPVESESEEGSVSLQNCTFPASVFDVTIIIIGCGCAVSLLIFLYFLWKLDLTTKSTGIVLQDVLKILVTVVGSWINYSTDIATFTRIIQPRPELDEFELPVIIFLSIGGVSIFLATIGFVWILVRLHSHASESEEEKMRYLVRFVKTFRKEKWKHLLAAFHMTNPEMELKENPEWKGVFGKLLKNTKHTAGELLQSGALDEDESKLQIYAPQEDSKRLQYELGRLPGKQYQTYIESIRTNRRERTYVYINTALLILQTVPMFLITVGPIMGRAPAEDIRSPLFRFSVFIGAIVIGSKIEQAQNYASLQREEQTTRKQLYRLILATRGKSVEVQNVSDAASISNYEKDSQRDPKISFQT